MLVVTSQELEKSWIMNSKYSYRICPTNEYIETVRWKAVELFTQETTMNVPEFKLSISMFDGLNYSTRIEHEIMEIQMIQRTFRYKNKKMLQLFF
jgi:hypothetical protein